MVQVLVKKSFINATANSIKRTNRPKDATGNLFNALMVIRVEAKVGN
jgi:hypothetical protein